MTNLFKEAFIVREYDQKIELQRVQGHKFIVFTVLINLLLKEAFKREQNKKIELQKDEAQFVWVKHALTSSL